jgi:hypothetical protein
MDSGQLGPAGAAAVLHDYAAAGATGCLRFQREGLHARVYYRDGLVYAAAAPGARARLGDRLVGAGYVTEEELATTLVHQESLSESRRIGELLIERGLIDRETMRAFVREQSTDSVAVALGWPDGTWTFTAGEEIAEDVPLDMSVENLVMEGARRLEEWEVIRQRIGSVDAVPDFAPREDTAELALTPDEWSMLTRIDGRSSIAEIAEEAGYSEVDAGRIIYGLLTAGIVTLVEDERSTDEAGGAGAGGEEPHADFDPTEASELFGELGLEEPAPGRRGAGPDSDIWQDTFTDDAGDPGSVSDDPTWSADDEAPWGDGEGPGWDPDGDTADEPDAGEPPRASGSRVNRNELFREFAALDDPGEGDPGGPPPPPAARTPPPRRPPQDADDDKGKRKGLFGRRKRG